MARRIRRGYFIRRVCFHDVIRRSERRLFQEVELKKINPIEEDLPLCLAKKVYNREFIAGFVKTQQKENARLFQRALEELQNERRNFVFDQCGYLWGFVIRCRNTLIRNLKAAVEKVKLTFIEERTKLIEDFLRSFEWTPTRNRNQGPQRELEDILPIGGDIAAIEQAIAEWFDGPRTADILNVESLGSKIELMAEEIAEKRINAFIMEIIIFENRSNTIISRALTTAYKRGCKAMEELATDDLYDLELGFLERQLKEKKAQAEEMLESLGIPKESLEYVDEDELRQKKAEKDLKTAKSRRGWFLFCNQYKLFKVV